MLMTMMIFTIIITMIIKIKSDAKQYEGDLTTFLLHQLCQMLQLQFGVVTGL